MSIFIYTALDKANAYLKGKIEAGSVKKATSKLEQEGLLVVNIKLEKHHRLARFDKYLTRVSRIDKIFFTSHLHTLLESGVALDQAVRATAEQTTNPRFKEVLMDVYHNIQRGQSLYFSLSRHKQYFSNFYLSLVRVGETSGKLDNVLAYLLEQQERDYELLVKARGAMIYPSIILLALLVMVGVMIVFVIPNVTAMLLEYKVELPVTTKILIFVSNLFIHYGVFVVPILVLLLFVLRRLIRTPKGQWFWDGILLRIPRFKTIIIEFNLARFARAMSSLLKSGIATDQALELSVSVLGNTRYKKSILTSIGFIQKGISLSEVVSGYPKLYPPVASRMIEVGERSGRLEYMLGRLANFYEKSVTSTLGNISSIIEPLLLLAIGLMVAFVAISVLSPIWKFSSTI